MKATIGALTALLFFAVGPAFAREQLSDAQIRAIIIRESIAQYQATGHPCACPYNRARNGSSCGSRSAYSRPGGAEPLCYPNDVNDTMVETWKRAHP